MNVGPRVTQTAQCRPMACAEPVTIRKEKLPEKDPLVTQIDLFKALASVRLVMSVNERLTEVCEPLATQKRHIVRMDFVVPVTQIEDDDWPESQKRNNRPQHVTQIDLWTQKDFVWSAIKNNVEPIPW